MSENQLKCALSITDEKYFEKCALEFREKWYATDNKQSSSNIKDFERLRTLGTGSFGRVILVRHNATSQYLAMKVLSKTKVLKMKQAIHTISEKQILAAIDHPFIVNLKYSFKDNFNLYMVMEFVIGGEMFTHLRNAGFYSEEQARFFASNVILAFEYLHHLNIVYRDLKPENLLIDHIGYIKITDFGFAKRIQKRTYTLCGTPEYLAPEILLNKGYSRAVDWWALGILIYEMTAGYPPFFDNEPIKTYEKIIGGKFKLQNSFSESLTSLLRGLLEKDLSLRLGNMKNQAEDIKNHKWFHGNDWVGIFHKRIPAEHIPTVLNSADASNFDKYDEEPIGSCDFPMHEEEFKDF